MEQHEAIVKTFADLVNRYHDLRGRHGIDAPQTEWARAEIAGARILLDRTFGDDERSRVFAEVRARTSQENPHRDRDWAGWDSEVLRER
jgi:hypothetical protein